MMKNNMRHQTFAFIFLKEYDPSSIYTFPEPAAFARKQDVITVNEYSTVILIIVSPSHYNN